MHAKNVNAETASTRLLIGHGVSKISSPAHFFCCRRPIRPSGAVPQMSLLEANDSVYLIGSAGSELTLP